MTDAIRSAETGRWNGRMRETACCFRASLPAPSRTDFSDKIHHIPDGMHTHQTDAVHRRQVLQTYLRQDAGMKAELFRLGHPAVRLADRPYLSAEPDLSEGDDVFPDRTVLKAGDHGHHDSQINGRFRDPDSARDVHIGVAAGDLKAKPFFQHGHQKAYPG